MTGKHHAPGQGGVAGGEICPRCGAAVAGQFCEVCGFRVSARRPFAPLGGPAEPAAPAPGGRAEPWEMSPPAARSSGPPESLFPPVSRPEPPFSAWSRPEPSPAPPPAAEPGPPDDAGAVDLLESLFSPPSPSPSAPPPPPAPPAPAAAPGSSPPPTTPIPSLASVTWTVLVASDRAYFDRMQATRGRLGPAVEFPAHASQRRIRLTGTQMRIGRRSAARDLVPEIDLADQPVDPGVSRLHAVLTPAPDGTWSIQDPGSANGTLVNGREIMANEIVTLHEGDRINLGAWTVITVHRG